MINEKEKLKIEEIRENYPDIMPLSNAKGEYVFPISLSRGIVTENGKTVQELLAGVSTDIEEMVIKLLEGAPEEHDTLKEISDAINDGNTEIGAILKQLTTLRTSIDNLRSELTTNYMLATSIESVFAKKTDIPESSDLSNYVTNTQLNNALSDIEDKDTTYTAGEGIEINNTVISAKPQIIEVTKADMDSLVANGTLADGTVENPNILYVEGA